MDWINTNLYCDFGYGLWYLQLFLHLGRRSDEAQAATLEMGKENAKRWLNVFNGPWLGQDRKFLCGDHTSALARCH
jgi:glutathione S-transferase